MLGSAPTDRTRRGAGLDEEALRDLMVRYQQADEVAAGELVRRVTPLLFGFLSRSTHSRSETEDLVQDCWLRIHKSRHTYRPSEPVLPWIFAIARHTGLDGYRRRRRVESRELAMEQLPEQGSAPGSAGDSLGKDLTRLVESLPESQREVIMMLKVSGMTLEEVARATSSTVGSVKQKAHRAYEKLRRSLAEEA